MSKHNYVGTDVVLIEQSDTVILWGTITGTGYDDATKVLVQWQKWDWDDLCRCDEEEVPVRRLSCSPYT